MRSEAKSRCSFPVGLIPRDLSQVRELSSLVVNVRRLALFGPAFLPFLSIHHISCLLLVRSNAGKEVATKS